MRTVVATLAGVVVVSLPWLLTPRASGDEKRPSAPDDAGQSPRVARPADPAGPANSIDQFLSRRLAAQIVFNDGDAQRKALSFIRSNQAHADALGSLEQCKTCHDPGAGAPELLAAGQLGLVPVDAPWIGVSVGPADDVLRSQLKLPDGTGVVVTKVLPDSPAAGAGIAEHDILLSVDNQPVPDGDMLDAIVKGAKAGAPPLALKLLRQGKPVEAQVAPAQPAARHVDATYHLAHQPQYRIGVSTAQPDETLRSQLRLGEEGVIVTAVADEGPAAKQGVRVNDVLLSANHKPLKDPQDLVAAVRSAGQSPAPSPVELELLRGGVRLKVAVTPEKYAAAETMLRRLSLDLTGASDAQELMLVQPYVEWINRAPAAKPATQPTGSARERLDQITTHLDQLRAAVDALKTELKEK